MRPTFLRPERIPYASIEIIRAAVPEPPKPVVDVAIVPVPDQPVGPVVEVVIVRQPDLAKPAQAAKWYAANCPTWRKGGAR